MTNMHYRCSTDQRIPSECNINLFFVGIESAKVQFLFLNNSLSNEHRALRIELNRKDGRIVRDSIQIC